MRQLAFKVDMKRAYARNLEFALFRKGLTVTALAKILGVSPHVVHRVRQGKTQSFSLELLSALCEVFECTPNDFLLPHPEISYEPPSK